MTKEIKEFNLSAKTSILALYESLEEERKKRLAAQTKLDNKDNSNLFNGSDKLELLDDIELKYVKYFQDNFNSKINKNIDNFALMYDYYSYGILMYMRENFPMRPSKTNQEKYDIQDKNNKQDKNLIKWRLTLLDKNGSVLYKLIDTIINHTYDYTKVKNEDLILKSELTSNSLVNLNGVDFQIDYIWLREKDEEEGFYFGYARELFKHKELVLLIPLQK